MKISSSLVNGLLANCTICPRRCGSDRTKGEPGYCRAGFKPRVYSHSPHHGEEPVLSGTRGSGTIFFSHCNMRCVYCQNYYFSQLDEGEELSIEGLSETMLRLAKMKCHNINLVSPTHYAPQIALAARMAKDNGLDIPIVYNSGGYDLVDTLRLLDGIIDIYMPDMRYSSDEMAKKYSEAVQYVEYNRRACVEMHRQVGDLVVDEHGIARKGLIIRLLVLPDDISGTKETLRFIAKEVSRKAFLSIMSQYYPTFKAYGYKEISRGITSGEYLEIIGEAESLGLENGWIQERSIDLDLKFAGTSIKRQGGQIG